MNAEEINKKIQTEKDSFNRNLNRLQKQIFELKQRHQRTMEYWQRQKEQTKINIFIFLKFFNYGNPCFSY